MGTSVKDSAKYICSLLFFVLCSLLCSQKKHGNTQKPLWKCKFIAVTADHILGASQATQAVWDSRWWLHMQGIHPGNNTCHPSASMFFVCPQNCSLLPKVECLPVEILGFFIQTLLYLITLVLCVSRYTTCCLWFAVSRYSVCST